MFWIAKLSRQKYKQVLLYNKLFIDYNRKVLFEELDKI